MRSNPVTTNPVTTALKCNMRQQNKAQLNFHPDTMAEDDQ
jgi:hypothetical protein